MTIAELFRQNLKRYREAAGLSQAELSRRMGHGANYVCGLERGRDGRAPSVETIGRVAQALGVTADALLRTPKKKSRKSAKRYCPYR